MDQRFFGILTEKSSIELLLVVENSMAHYLKVL